jgi:hypothetical protein
MYVGIPHMFYSHEFRLINYFVCSVHAYIFISSGETFFLLLHANLIGMDKCRNALYRFVNFHTYTLEQFWAIDVYCRSVPMDRKVKPRSSIIN